MLGDDILEIDEDVPVGEVFYDLNIVDSDGDTLSVSQGFSSHLPLVMC